MVRSRMRGLSVALAMMLIAGLMAVVSPGSDAGAADGNQGWILTSDGEVTPFGGAPDYGDAPDAGNGTGPGDYRTLANAEKLIEEILEYDSQLLDTISGNGVKIFMLSSTAYTDEFLESGSFKNLFIQEEEKWDTFLQHLGGGRSSKKKPIKKSTKSSLKRERQWIILLLCMLGFSFLVSLAAVVWTLFSEPKVTEKELEERLKRMEIRHAEEVQSLQRELKAIRQYHEADSSQ